MDLELAEATGERDVGVRVDRLTVEDEHLVGEQRLPQLGDDLVREVGAEVDAVDLPTDRRSEGPGVEVLPDQAAKALPFLLEMAEWAHLDAVGLDADPVVHDGFDCHPPIVRSSS